MKPLLFDADTVDSPLLIATAASLLSAVIGVTLIPSRLAARTDPVAVLHRD